MPVLNPREPTLAEFIRALAKSPPPPSPLPAPRVRTCHGCFNTFHVRQHGSHVRNACGHMISVDQLRAAIQHHANLCGEDSISFAELGVMIEQIAVTRCSSINAGLTEGEDIEVRVNKKRTSLLDHERKTRERVERRAQRRAERGVHTVTEQVSRMEL